MSHPTLLPPDAAPPFDRAELLDRLDGDAAAVAELADLLAEDWPRQERTAADALGRADAPALARVAHGIKGTLATLAAGPALATAQRLEAAAGAGDLARAAGLVAALGPQVAGLVAALTALGREGGA